MSSVVCGDDDVVGTGDSVDARKERKMAPCWTFWKRKATNESTDEL